MRKVHKLKDRRQLRPNEGFLWGHKPSRRVRRIVAEVMKKQSVRSAQKSKPKVQRVCTRQDLLQFQRSWFDSLVELTSKKNADYSGNAEDPFKNFTLVERLGICDAQTGMLVRICDKLARLASLNKRAPQVTTESFDDTLRDLANYSALLSALRVHRRTEKTR